jgi:cell division protein FtsQ
MRRKHKSASQVRPNRRQISLLETFRNFYGAKRYIFLASFILLPTVAWSLGWIQLGFQHLGYKGEQILAASGFIVNDILVEGRRQTDPQTILTAIGASRGDSIFKCDPNSTKEHLEKITWIQSATVQRRLPGTIYIRLVERNPIAIWQNESKLYLVDEHGAVIENFDSKEFNHLLVVTGLKAPTHTKDLLDSLSDFPELREKIQSAVFISGRRWDLIMINKVRVKLPEKNIKLALTHLERLEKEHRLTDGRVGTIDLRLPDRSFLYVQEAEDDKKNKGKIT